MIQFTDVQIGFFIATIVSAFAALWAYIVNTNKSMAEAWRTVDSLTASMNAIVAQNGEILKQNSDLLKAVSDIKTSFDVSEQLKKLSIILENKVQNG